MNMDKQAIDKLVNEAATTVPIMEVYDMALSNLDLEAMKATEGITREDLCANMAMAGFMAGIRFTLENLDLKEVEDAAQ